jgi:phosphoglycerate dehydrogenase-like enzyme
MKIWVDSYVFDHPEMKRVMLKYPHIQFENQLKEAYDATIMISMPKKIKPDILDHFKSLKWIQLLTAGYDQIDLQYLNNRGILISYAKDVFSIQIAEDVFSKILFLNRRLDIFYEQQKNKEWSYHSLDHEIYGSIVGIIGAGSIGHEVAKRMKAFGATVLGYKKTPSKLPFYDTIYTETEGLKTLLSTSDIIVITIPLNQNTYHMIGTKELSLMKKNACLINVARGDIIDQDALIHALKTKQIRALGLDVTSPEPLPNTSPLWQLASLILTPHNASASPMMMKRIIFEVESSLECFLNHQPLDNLIPTKDV